VELLFLWPLVGLLGTLLAVVLALVLPSNWGGSRGGRRMSYAERRRLERHQARTQKTCPECAESVQKNARVCKHCGYRFDGEVRPA